MTWQSIKDWFRRAWNAGEDYIEIPPKEEAGEESIKTASGVQENPTRNLGTQPEKTEMPQKVEIQGNKCCDGDCDCGHK